MVWVYLNNGSVFRSEWGQTTLIVRREHSIYWEPTARRYNMSKHQQVQAMQAAMQLLNFAHDGQLNWMQDLPEVRFLDLK